MPQQLLKHLDRKEPSDDMHNLFQGLTTVLQGSNILYLVAGALIGVIFGVIPGIATPVVLSVMLVFTMHTSLEGTIALFLGTYAGSYFSASITSILLNTPAHPEAFAVTFDGYPMARRGEAARALGISAASTCIGGLVGCVLLAAFLPAMNSFPYLFHPPEYVALIILAMLMVGMLGCDSITKAVISTGLGFMVASVGTSQITGSFRYTFNNADLGSGFSLIAVALGLFAIPQMVMVFGTGTATARQDMSGREVENSAPVRLERGAWRQVLGGVREAFGLWRLQLQSGIVGLVTGVVPGIGGFAANFLSYGLAQQTSRKRRHLFGTGIPDGIVAAEASSLSKEAGSLIPIMGLGIPGSVGGALFLAALVIKGTVVGFGFTTRYPVLPYEMVWTIALTGIVGTAIGVVLAPMLAKVTRVPGPLLVPFIVALAVIGPYLADVTFTSVKEVAAFALVGLALRRLQYPVATFVLGLVLGPTFETNVYLTRGLYPGFSFITARPAADVIVLIGVAFPVLRVVRNRRAAKAAQAEPGGENTASDSRRATGWTARRSPYPVLGLIVTLALLGISTWFIVYGATNYNFVTATMPVFGGILVAACSLFRLPLESVAFVHFLHDRRVARLDGGGGWQPDTNTPSPVLAPAAGSPELSPTLYSASVITEPVVAPVATVHDGLPPIHEKSWGRHGQYTREVVALIWLGALVELVYLVGFLYALPTFCALYGLVATRRYFRSWLARAAFAAVSALVMWAVAWEGMRALHLVFVPHFTLPT
jgi:putative tricarboxylic transport membrane protein